MASAPIRDYLLKIARATREWRIGNKRELPHQIRQKVEDMIRGYDDALQVSSSVLPNRIRAYLKRERHPDWPSWISTWILYHSTGDGDREEWITRTTEEFARMGIKLWDWPTQNSWDGKFLEAESDIDQSTICENDGVRRTSKSTQQVMNAREDIEWMKQELRRMDKANRDLKKSLRKTMHFVQEQRAETRDLMDVIQTIFHLADGETKSAMAALEATRRRMDRTDDTYGMSSRTRYTERQFEMATPYESEVSLKTSEEEDQGSFLQQRARGTYRDCAPKGRKRHAEDSSEEARQRRHGKSSRIPPFTKKARITPPPQNGAPI